MIEGDQTTRTKRRQAKVIRKGLLACLLRNSAKAAAGEGRSPLLALPSAL